MVAGRSEFQFVVFESGHRGSQGAGWEVRSRAGSGGGVSGNSQGQAAGNMEGVPALAFPKTHSEAAVPWVLLALVCSGKIPEYTRGSRLDRSELLRAL